MIRIVAVIGVVVTLSLFTAATVIHLASILADHQCNADGNGSIMGPRQ